MGINLSVGDTIEYINHPKQKSARKREGIIIDLTDKFLVIDLGRYRDTILRSDLVSGQAKITYIKGDGNVTNRKRVEMPTPKELAAIFDKAGNNITRAAQMIEPPVSDVTMGKWLRQAGIIPASPRRVKKEAPPAHELRATWEASNHILAPVARKYEVTSPVIKRWLKEAGIIVETATGIQTVQASGKTEAAEDEVRMYTPSRQDEFTDDDDAPIPYTVVEENPDHATLKRMIDFCLAPVYGRIEKLEISLASVAKIVIDNHHSNRDETLDLLADLIVRIARRVDNAPMQRNREVGR